MSGERAEKTDGGTEKNRFSSEIYIATQSLVFFRFDSVRVLVRYCTSRSDDWSGSHPRCTPCCHSSRESWLHKHIPIGLLSRRTGELTLAANPQDPRDSPGKKLTPPSRKRACRKANLETISILGCCKNLSGKAPYY